MSHVNMDTTPSGQDETQAQSYNGKVPWLLRLIANKKGKIRCDLFWFEFGFIIKDMDWEIDYTSNLIDYENTFTQQAKECAHKHVYQAPTTLVSMPVYGGVAYPNTNFRPQTVIPGLSPVVISKEPGQQEFIDTSNFNQLTEEAFSQMLAEGR